MKSTLLNIWFEKQMKLIKKLESRKLNLILPIIKITVTSSMEVKPRN